MAFITSIDGSGVWLDHIVSIEEGGTVTLSEVEDNPAKGFDLDAARAAHTDLEEVRRSDRGSLHGSAR